MFKVTRSHGTRDVCVENYKIGTYLDKQKIKKYIAGVTELKGNKNARYFNKSKLKKKKRCVPLTEEKQ